MESVRKEKTVRFRKSGDDSRNQSEELDDIDITVVDSTISSESVVSGHHSHTWSGRLDFLFSCIGFSIGIGNVWRFPYVCYENGGGAFILPYALMVIFGVAPLVYLELLIGQYASVVPIEAWKIVPFFKGIGYCMVMAAFLTAIYYNVVISYCIFYFIISLKNQLDYASCNNEWNTHNCRDLNVAKSCVSTGDMGDNVTASWNSNVTTLSNSSTAVNGITTPPGCMPANSSALFTSPAAEYFTRYVLQQSSGLEYMGSVSWRLLLCLLTAWVVTYLCLIKGVKSSVKVVYFTTVVPWIIMTVFFFKNVSLEGSSKGIIYFLSARWWKLGDPNVWISAASQAFFSIGPCYGSYVILAKYNKFCYNVRKDVIIICIVDTLTSIFAGITVFAAIGFLSNELDKSIPDILTELGSNMVFIVYPEIIRRFSGSHWWSLLFFGMMILLGVDSQFTHVETITQSVMAMSPIPTTTWWRRRLLICGAVCLLSFILGIPMITEGGVYVMELMSQFSSVYGVMICGVLACVAVLWCYGWNRLSNDMYVMLSKKPSLFWKLAWKFVCPLLLLAVLLYGWTKPMKVTYGAYVFPKWGIVIGYIIAFISVAMIIVGMVQSMVCSVGSIKERIKFAFTGNDHWCPALESHRLNVNTNKMPDYISGGTDNDAFDNEFDDQNTISASLRTSASVEEDVYVANSWTGKYDFFLSCLGFSVGLGNLWRYPYLCFKHGGGAFLLAYAILLVFCGIPIYFVELAIGQYSGRGPMAVWEMAPILKGIGYAMVSISLMTSVYYTVIVSWTLYYVFASMNAVLPWIGCNHGWNTRACTTVLNITDSRVSTLANSTMMLRSPSEEYFRLKVLAVTSGISDIGEIRWHLCLCLLFCWIFICVSISIGIKLSGKIMYVSAILPLLLILLLLLWSVTLEGHREGVFYLVSPTWAKLRTAEVWYEAAVQVFFSLGTGYGSLIMLSSYNKFDADCRSTATYICLLDTATSMIGGFVVFGILGVLSEEANTDIHKIFKSDFDLAFIIYPEAVVRTPQSTALSLIFFILLFLLGIDTAFIQAETVILGIKDCFRKTVKGCHLPITLIATACIFLISIVFSSQGGFYLVKLMDTYAASWNVLLIGFVETVAIAWLYGFHRFDICVQQMLASKLSWYWWITICYSSPILILAVLAFSLTNFPTSRSELEFPVWAHMIGLVMMFGPILCILGNIVYQLLVARGTLKQRWNAITTFEKEWNFDFEGNLVEGSVERAVKRRRRVSIYSDSFAINPDRGLTQTRIQIPSGKLSEETNESNGVSSTDPCEIRNLKQAETVPAEVPKAQHRSSIDELDYDKQPAHIKANLPLKQMRRRSLPDESTRRNWRRKI